MDTTPPVQNSPTGSSAELPRQMIATNGSDAGTSQPSATAVPASSPETIQQAVLRGIWSFRPAAKWSLIVAFASMALFGAIWTAIPEPTQQKLLDRLFESSPSPVVPVPAVAATKTEIIEGDVLGSTSTQQSQVSTDLAVAPKPTANIKNSPVSAGLPPAKGSEPEKASSSATTVKKYKVIVMDSAIPSLVYDPASRTAGRTNADDIYDALKGRSDLSVDTEVTSLDWTRDEYIRDSDPDLIVIHISAFYEQRRPEDEERKFLSFLQFVAETRANVLMYTRTPALQTPAGNAAYIAHLESQVPELSGRLNLFMFEPKQNKSFRDSTVARNMKMKILSLLKAPPKTAA